jgi:hypothetical protein
MFKCRGCTYGCVEPAPIPAGCIKGFIIYGVIWEKVPDIVIRTSVASQYEVRGG